MNIGVSSASFYPHINTEDSIALMHNSGFDNGEIFLNSPSEYEEQFIEKVIEQRNQYRFNINSIHSFCATFEPFLFDKYKRRREDMFEVFKKVCKAGKQLGANYYTFHGLKLKNFQDLDLDLILEVYNKLIYTAEEIGITLAQENVSWCMSSEIDFIKVLNENCKYPISYTLDVKQAYKAKKLPIEYMKTMDKNLVNFHINDRDEKNICLLPGKGQVNFEQLFNDLNKINYNKNIIIEVYRENYNNYNELYDAKLYLQKYSL